MKKAMSFQQNNVDGNDLSSYKNAFQNMLMSSNNKIVELLKNKQKTKELQETHTGLPKGILKNVMTPRISQDDSDDEYASSSKQNNFSMKFSPIASSTQVDTNLLLSKTPKRSLDSFDSNKASPLKKIKKRKETISESDSSEVSEKEIYIDISLHRKYKDSEKINCDDGSSAELSFKKKKTHRAKETNDDEVNIKSFDETYCVSERNSEIDQKQHKGKNKKNKSVEDPNRLKNKGKPGSQLMLSKELHSEVDNNISNNKNLTTLQNISNGYEQDESSDSNFQEKGKAINSDHSNEKFKSKFSKSGELLNQYQEKFNLSKINDEVHFLKDISPHEELFLIQVPKTLDPKVLEGIEIKLNKKKKFSVEGQKYDSLPIHKEQTINLLSGPNEIQSVQCSGNIKIVRHLKRKHLPNMSSSSSSVNIPFPSNLKERHPLFGADYDDKISLEEHVQQKLKAALKSNTRGKKKKVKKEKLDKNDEKGKLNEEEEIFKFLRQTGETNESGTNITQKIRIEKEPRKKKKSMGTSNTSTEFDEVFKMDTESPPKTKKSKNRSKDAGIKIEAHADFNDSKEKKKHIKKKEPIDVDTTSQLINEMLLLKSNEMSGESSSSSKKKRKIKTKD